MSYNSNYSTEKRLDLAELLIQVLEKPKARKIIASTQIPDMTQPWEEEATLYFTIQKGDDGWFVSNSEGNCSEFPEGNMVLQFFDRVTEATKVTYTIQQN